jgi:UDP-2,3-diacylglucosamine hydrolase
MTTLFISDLHLSSQRPDITELFVGFLEDRAAHAEALYILGDLFEVWLGDDMTMPEYQNAIDGLRRLSDGGVSLFFMHGNRDFLVREAFELATGASLLEEPHCIELNGEKTLLMHGDTLCTDDVEYQKFRAMVRDPQWQRTMLAKSPEERLALAQQYRTMSQTETANKEEAIMDVNQQAVEQIMRQYGVLQLIHGHTHRPHIHHFRLDGKPAKRLVLGDWYEQGSVLECDDKGCRLETLAHS